MLRVRSDASYPPWPLCPSSSIFLPISFLALAQTTLLVCNLQNTQGKDSANEKNLHNCYFTHVNQDAFVTSLYITDNSLEYYWFQIKTD